MPLSEVAHSYTLPTMTLDSSVSWTPQNEDLRAGECPADGIYAELFRPILLERRNDVKSECQKVDIWRTSWLELEGMHRMRTLV